MAFFIAWGLCKPGIKTGTLFGDGHVPIKQYCCGFFVVIRLNIHYMMLFHEMAKSDLSLEDFLIERAPQVVEYKDEVWRICKSQAEERAKELTDHWIDSSRRATERQHAAEIRATQAEAALKVMMRLRDEG